MKDRLSYRQLYDELEALAAALDEVRKLMPYGELEIAEAADFSKP